MYVSFNSIIMICLVLYVIWMAIHENTKEKASEAKLSPDQLKRFNKAYVFAQPATEYDADLQAHAAVAQRARIRKAASAVILGIAVLLILFRAL